jgi:hypothetical protein
MKATSKGKRKNNLLALFCGFALMWLVISTVFMRFVHYDSQYRSLNPEHYNVKVITAEDHKQLSNPENRTVTLSNGTKSTKSETWYSHILPKYKSVNDDSQYVLVTLRGTAPFMHIWYGGITSTVTVCIVGLFWGLRRKRVKEPQETQEEK